MIRAVKIIDVLSQARKILDSQNIISSNLDANLLLAHSLSFSREQIVFNPNLELDSNQQQKFFDLIKLRAGHKPVSQIIGKREFFGEDFLVTSDVLDPRPDSESLIELVLKKIPHRDKKLNILELGSGSGCLIITLLKQYQSAMGLAIDISDKALEICQKNSVSQGVKNRLRLLNSDLFDKLNPIEKFDLIISNPPYIPSAEIDSLAREVKIHEPRIALDGGDDGLNFYRRIAAKSKNFLQRDGLIILEIGCGQEDLVIEIFRKNNFIFIESKPDLSGIIRVLSFKKC